MSTGRGMTLEDIVQEMKKHPGEKIAAIVWETDDYSKFKKMQYNRSVLEKRVEKLVASLSIKRILNPIEINPETKEIGDGQGRYEALKRLKLPIQYIEDPQIDIEACRIMNQYNSNWTIVDFVNSYADAGNKNYERLRHVCEEINIPVMRALIFSHRSNISTRINGGMLKFTEKDAELAKETYEHASEILKALCFTGRTNAAFDTAVSVAVITEGYDKNRMIGNCKLCRSTYTQMSSIKDELAEFSRIYNFRRSKEKLYFKDYMRNKGYSVRDYSESKGTFGEEKDSSTLKGH